MRPGGRAVRNSRDRSPRVGASRSLTGLGPRDEIMDALMPAAPVHYFDTSLHRIACGVRGSDHRSTKHSRDVTCDACLGLLRDQPSKLAPSTPSAAP